MLELRKPGGDTIFRAVRFGHNTATVCSKLRACALVNGKQGLVACDMPYMHVDLRFVASYLASRAASEMPPHNDAFWDGFVNYENSEAPPQS